MSNKFNEMIESYAIRHTRLSAEYVDGLFLCPDRGIGIDEAWHLNHFGIDGGWKWIKSFGFLVSEGNPLE